MVMTSDEVAYRAHAQTAMFGANRHYAQQVGYTGGGNGPPPPPPPPMPPPPRGDAMGTRMAQQMAGGAGMAGAGVLTAATWGMGMGAMAPALAMGAGMDAYGGALQRGAQHFGQTQQTLGQNFKFFGGQGAGGRGFGIGQQGQINSMMQGTAQQDFRTNMNELQSLVQSGAQNGMFVGVQDVKAFSAKFKEMLGTLKTVQNELGGTLKEAMDFAKNAKQAGIFGAVGITSFSKSVRESMASTGFNQGETMQMAQNGAAISRSVGGTGAQGATGAARTVGTMGAALRSGAISEEMISESTGGLTGKAGLMALTNKFMQNTAKYSRTAAGRYGTFAMSNSDATGIDQEALSAMMSGDTSVGDISKRAHTNVNRMGRGRAINREGFLRGAILEQGGLSGQIGIMKQRLGGRLEGLDDDTASLVMQRMHGMSRQDAEVMQNLMKNQGSILEQELMDKTGSRRAQDEERYLAENSMDALVKQFTKGASESLGINKAERIGSQFAEGMSEMMSDLTDSILGISRSKMSRGQNAMLTRMKLGTGTDSDQRYMKALGGMELDSGITEAGLRKTGGASNLSKSLGGSPEGGARSIYDTFSALGLNDSNRKDITSANAVERIRDLTRARAGEYREGHGPLSDSQRSKFYGAISKAKGSGAELDPQALLAIGARAAGVDSEDAIAFNANNDDVIGLEPSLGGEGPSVGRATRDSAAAKKRSWWERVMGKGTAVAKGFGYGGVGMGNTAALDAIEKKGKKETIFDKVFSKLKIGKGQEGGVRSFMKSEAGLKLMDDMQSGDKLIQGNAIADLEKAGANSPEMAALARVAKRGAFSGENGIQNGILLGGPEAAQEMKAAHEEAKAQTLAISERMLATMPEGSKAREAMEGSIASQRSKKGGSATGIMGRNLDYATDVDLSDEQYKDDVEALSKQAEGSGPEAEQARNKLLMVRTGRAKYNELRGKGRRGRKQGFDTAITELGIDAHDIKISSDDGKRSRMLSGTGMLSRVLMGGNSKRKEQALKQMTEMLQAKGAKSETIAQLEAFKDGKIDDGEAGKFLRTVKSDTNLQDSRRKEYEDRLAAKDPLGSERNKLLAKSVELQTAQLRRVDAGNVALLSAAEKTSRAIYAARGQSGQQGVPESDNDTPSLSTISQDDTGGQSSEYGMSGGK